MARALVINDAITIPAAELQVSFARSAGPGGQNVNKVNTKAQLRWAARESAALPPAVKARLLARYGNRINNEGELVLTSDEHREQARNLNACREKLRAMILSVLKPPRRRVKTKPTRASVERRIVSKQRQAEKKRSRRGGIDRGE
jgi:ribosome-associated protein